AHPGPGASEWQAEPEGVRRQPGPAHRTMDLRSAPPDSVCEFLAQARGSPAAGPFLLLPATVSFRFSRRPLKGPEPRVRAFLATMTCITRSAVRPRGLVILAWPKVV